VPLRVVTASVNNLTARRTVEFTHAYPDDVSLAVQGSFRLTASFSTKATLRAELSRKNYQPRLIAIGDRGSR